MSIEGKVAPVTGTCQGIERAIALRLANDGAHIAMMNVKHEKTKAVADEVRKVGRRATTFKADVSKRDDVSAALSGRNKSHSAIVRMTRHGLPAAKTASGTSRVTTLPAPMTAREALEKMNRSANEGGILRQAG
jgi:hypothetical protein